MKNIAFVFPGQGAQYVGMAREFYELSEYKHFFEEANERLGYDLSNIMFDGPEDELKKHTILNRQSCSTALLHIVTSKIT